MTYFRVEILTDLSDVPPLVIVTLQVSGFLVLEWCLLDRHILFIGFELVLRMLFRFTLDVCVCQSKAMFTRYYVGVHRSVVQSIATNIVEAYCENLQRFMPVQVARRRYLDTMRLSYSRGH